MPGFEEAIANLEAIKTSAREAAAASAKAGAERIAAAARELAPIHTGLLKSTITAVVIHTYGNRTTAAATVGSEETITTWRGVGYEVFQELGTSNGVPAIHYMHNAVLVAMDGMLNTMAIPFVEVMRGGQGITAYNLGRRR